SDGRETRGEGAVEDRVDIGRLVAEDRAQPEREPIDEDDLASVRPRKGRRELVSDLDRRPRRGPGSLVACDPVVELGVAGPGRREEPDTPGVSGQPCRGGQPERALPAAGATEDEDERLSHGFGPSRGERRRDQGGG